MADIDVAKIQSQIKAFKQQNADIVAGKNDSQIISIMEATGKISHTNASIMLELLNNKKAPNTQTTLTNKPKAASIYQTDNTLQSNTGDEICFSTLANEIINIADENNGEKSLSLISQKLNQLDSLSDENFIKFLRSFDEHT